MNTPTAPLPPTRRAPDGTARHALPLPAIDRHALLALPAQARQVPEVRHFITAHTLHWGLPKEDQERAELIGSELAANAARHGRSDMSVHLTMTASTLHIEVTNTGPPPLPYGLPPPSPGESGRGLHLVALTADEFHISPRKEGWRTHAAVNTHPTSHARPASPQQAA